MQDEPERAMKFVHGHADENDHEPRPTARPQAFLDGTRAVAFKVATSKTERYQWVQKMLIKHRYLQSRKADKIL